MPRPTPFLIAPPDDFLAHNPHLKTLSRDLSAAYAAHQLITDDDLQVVGSALWDALALGDRLENACFKAGQQALPIVIEADDAAVLGLPWETLHHPRFGFLGRETSFTLSRKIRLLQTALPDVEPGPLRVLLFTALPDNLEDRERLSVEAEQAAVQEALGGLEKDGWVRLEMPNDGRFETFKSCLSRFQPHLVYLSGHGKYVREAHNRKAWGNFLFEGPTGEPNPVAETEIADCFRQTQVQTVVISACESGKQSSAELSNGLAQTLAHRGIPHVIGMRESIFDAAGIQFARAFFHAVGHKEGIDVALQQARAAITRPLQGDVYRSIADPIHAELSYGQWCLPLLLSQNLERATVDWRFQPVPRTGAAFNRTLGNVSLPERFIGRRRDLRRWQNRLTLGQIQSLLLTGAGGMGKTALAGKLVETLQKQGYETYVYSARTENRWDDFLYDLQLALDKDHADRYERGRTGCADESARARLLLDLLMVQHQNRVALFFDNLESAQDPQSLKLTDSNLPAWIAEARRLGRQGLRLILTSRWKLPDWPDAAHCPLGKPVYGDFVALARQQNLPSAFLNDYERMRQAYEVLGGNFRGLVFFAEAIETMSLQEEQEFLDRLAKAEDDTQADMALAAVIAQRSDEERDLLLRLLAFEAPVPFDGVRVLAAPDLANPRGLLDALLNVSLVEQYENSEYRTTDYQLSPLVRDWLHQHSEAETRENLLKAAAEFQLWLLENERRTVNLALATHAALNRAGLIEAAHRVILEWIVGPFTLAGLFRTLAEDWLPPLLESDNLPLRSQALMQIGKQYFHLGDFDNALDYLQQSLEMCRQIGDNAGEGATLNNLSQVHDARGNYDAALDYVQQSLNIRQQLGDKCGVATSLHNLSGLYSTRGDPDTALDLLQQALEIQREIGNKLGEGATLNNLSQLYKASGDYDTALHYLKHSLAICRQIGDRLGEGATLNNLSQIYDVLGDYDTALDYLRQALTIAQQIGVSVGICATLFNLGRLHYRNKRFKEAFECWNTVYLIAKKIQLAQALAALETLAGNLGLSGGLDAWEKLSQQYEERDAE